MVDHTILELDGHLVEGKPNTAAGVRRIYLDDEITGLLKAHRKALLAARMRAGADWQDHGLVFCRYDGTPWRPSDVSRRFAALAQAAGMPVIKLHEARHSAISLMRDAGVRDGHHDARGRAHRPRCPCPLHARAGRGASAGG